MRSDIRSAERRHEDQRIAVYLDIENLVHDLRECEDWNGVSLTVSRVVRSIAASGTIVACVTSCNRSLARRLFGLLVELGVRVFVHRGGPDAADRALLARMQSDLPPSCDSVVIASGDHIFAPAAESLVAAGRRVCIMGRRGCIARALYRSGADVVELSAPVDSRAVHHIMPSERMGEAS